MSNTVVHLTEGVARALLLDIATKFRGYNDAWSWWAYEAGDKSYPYGGGVARKEQFTDDDDTLDLIISIVPDMEEDPVYFRVRGEASSYGKDKWEATVKEVKPTQRVVRVYA